MIDWLSRRDPLDMWKECCNNSVSVTIDSGASGHHFDDALISRLQPKLYDNGELAIPRAITPRGGHHRARDCKGLLHGHIEDGEEV